MDIKWKVQVLDKMFDDTYVRNLYLKMKYNTLGRFSFDIRDFGTVEVESYFAVGNTIRIFWGDILKMEGVIQKLIRSTTSWGWSIYGCDLNGLLLDRTPNMPYELGCDTLTIANSVMYAGCDFPTSMWGVGDGEEQGAYVLRYKVGLNTAYKHLRNLPHDLTWQTATGGEGGIVSSVTTTSIVDNTKTWVADQWKDAYVRMITGARKNTVAKILRNTNDSLAVASGSDLPVFSGITSWGGMGSSDGKFNGAFWMTSRGGVIYTTDSGNYRVQIFSSNGVFISKFGTQGAEDGQFYNPTGIGVSDSGYIYVADANANRIQKFTSSGGFVLKWGGTGNTDGKLSSPAGIAVDNAGNVYVADSGNRRVQKFSSDGNLIAKWGSYGSGDGQFRWPTGVAIDSMGYVYVSDQTGQSIQKFTPSGGFVSKYSHTGYVIGVAVDMSDNIYFSDGNDVWKLSNSFEYIAKTHLNSSRGIAAIEDYVYVVANNYIYKYSCGNPLSGDYEYLDGINAGDIYELTKGQTITWTKKYRVTNVKMTKNTHVINYNHTKDASKTHNSISVSGRDDNGGQIYTSLDDSSPITTLLSQESILSAPISASDATIPVHDTTGFASSGEAWIE